MKDIASQLQAVGQARSAGKAILFSYLTALLVLPTKLHQSVKARFERHDADSDDRDEAETTETGTTGTTVSTMASHGASTASSSVALNDAPAGLVPDTLFDGVDALFDQLAALPADCDSLVIGKVSIKSFRAIEAERDRRRRHYRLTFLPDIASVIVSIPTGGHERAHLSLFQLVIEAIRDMGLQRQWVGSGAETLAALGGVSAAGQGEGDSTGGPRRQHDGSLRVWPTLVIEAGATQTLPSLRTKARWWFAASDYAMKVVVLVKIVAATSSIEIEKWIAAGPGPQRQGATATRASRVATARQLVVDQRVLINWTGPAPLPQTPLAHRALQHFAVEGAPLVLRFQELMDRQPVVASGEHDVSIVAADLQDLAQRVWERM